MENELHYAAFISYRHSGVDSAIAKAVHRQLEQYLIPNAIRKETGRKKVGRLFRDKDELPLTEDINGNILYALEHSDYLIVICSPRTKQSPWVLKEIELFLQTHPISRVLTVLAEGEPSDVIPEILLQDISAAGEVPRMLEPLSADYRLPPRLARREELPRLAAALIGCSYDSLRRRQQQYQRRRTTAFLTVAFLIMAGFTGYALYSREQIRDNLNQALLNQSVYLANASQQALEDGNRLDAICLALAALPDGENDRPYAAEAEYALASALGVYGYDSTIHAQAVFRCNEIVQDFLATDDGNTLWAYDSSETVFGWDVDSNQLFYSQKFDDDIKKILLIDDDLLLFHENGTCRISRSGIVWENQEGSSLGKAAMNREKTRIAVVTYVDTDCGNGISILCSETGEVLSTVLTDEFVDALGDSYGYVSSLQFSQDSSQVYFTASMGTWDHSVYHLCCLDIASGSMVDMKEYSDCYLETPQVLPNGNLIVISTPQDADDVGSFINMTMCMEYDITLQCLNPETCTVLWETSFSAGQYNEDPHCSVVTYSDGTNPEQEVLVFAGADTCAILSPEDGTLLNHYRLQSQVLFSGWTGDGAFVITSSGCTVTCSCDDNMSRSIPYFSDSLAHARRVSNLYFTSEKRHTYILYSIASGKHDYACSFETEETTGEWSDHFWNFEGGMVYVSQSGEQALLQVFNPDGSLRGKAATDVFNYYRCEYLGYSAGTNQLAFQISYGSELALLSLDNFEITMFTVGAENGYLSLQLLLADALILSEKEYSTGTYRLLTYNLATEETHNCNVQFDAEIIQVSRTPIENTVLVETETSLYLLRLEEETMTALDAEPLPLNYGDTKTAIGWNSDGTLLAVAQTEAIRVLSPDGAAVRDYAVPSGEITCLFFHDSGDLVMLYTNGKLVRISQEDGSVVSRWDLPTYQGSKVVNTSLQRRSNGDYVLISYSMLNVLDGETLALKASAQSIAAYFPEADAYCFSDSANSNLPSYLPHYSLEQLMVIAEEQLGSYEMTEEQLAAYGLS